MNYYLVTTNNAARTEKLHPIPLAVESETSALAWLELCYPDYAEFGGGSILDYVAEVSVGAPAISVAIETAEKLILDGIEEVDSLYQLGRVMNRIFCTDYKRIFERIKLTSRFFNGQKIDDPDAVAWDHFSYLARQPAGLAKTTGCGWVVRGRHS